MLTAHLRARMSYMLPNRPSISWTSDLYSRLNTLEVDGIAIVGTSNGHIYHFRVFIYNHALGCSLSLDCNPTYDARDPDKACVTVAFKSYVWTTSQNAPPGRIPPSTGPFEAKLTTSTKVWKICNVLFDSLRRDHYRCVDDPSIGCVINLSTVSTAVWDAGTGALPS